MCIRARGAWTLPHLHRAMEESFFILDGEFTFTVGEERVEVGPGMYVLVPRGTSHAISAGNGGGRFLTLMVPGGLEEMFFELGDLGPDSIRDVDARAAVSARYDSVPV
jgi:mannose-6-phosphate isomerase-like protein (cupin superfamily)